MLDQIEANKKWKGTMVEASERVALVTGASSGIGKATAIAFSAKGIKVVLAARRQKEITALANELETRGGNATTIKTDVSNKNDVERMVDHVIKTYGRLDYAVNSAGTEGHFSGIVDLKEEDWDQVMSTNLKGTFLCLKYEAIAMMSTACGGAIVNVGSFNSFLGFASGSAYVASKHGLIGLTSSVSAELAPQGIRVNLVCPGIINTPMHQRLRDTLGDEVYNNALTKSVHLRRAGQPEEIAQTILFLCSNEASYITGSTITPDGGFTLTT